MDEAITFFRANIFFKNFDYKSSADKLLIYLTLYINLALKRLEGCRTLAEGKKSIINLGLEKIVIPGEAGFPFPGLFASPKSHKMQASYVLLLYYPQTKMLIVISSSGEKKMFVIILKQPLKLGLNR